MSAPGALALATPPPAVRDDVRRALTAAEGFVGLDPEDRRTIAHSLVRIAHAARLLEGEARTGPAPEPAPVRAMNAGDEFSGAAVDRVAATTRGVLRAISFPRFVAELIQGVFGAMVETNQQQIQQYVELVRGVSQSLEGFASLAGDDDMARRWLAERFPQSYAIEEPDPDDPPDPEDGPEPLRLVATGAPPGPEALRSALGLEPGAEIPSGGGEAMTRFVRAALARNRQQTLATMVQLGMQRIVIDSGRISAAMRFHIDARSAAAEDRGTSFDTRTTVGASGSFGVGPWSASASVNSTIGYVSTTDVSTREELDASADLSSSVELHFRTDQVPLDRIASQQTVERLTLNTLNPERELDIAREADAARRSERTAIETARAGRPRQSAAPTPPAPPPTQTAAPPAPSTQRAAPPSQPATPPTQPPATTTQPPAPSTQPPAPAAQPPAPSTQSPAPSTQPPAPSTQPAQPAAPPGSSAHRSGATPAAQAPAGSSPTATTPSSA